MKRVLSLCVLATAFAAVQAWGQQPDIRPLPIQPVGPHQRGGLDVCAAQVEGDSVVLTRTQTVLQKELRKETRKVDGKEVLVEVIVVVTKAMPVAEKVSLKDVRAFGGDGKPLTPETLAGRLKQSTPVFTMSGALTGKEPIFTGLLKDDTIVLALPAPPALLVPIQPPPPLPPPPVREP